MLAPARDVELPAGKGEPAKIQPYKYTTIRFVLSGESLHRPYQNANQPVAAGIFLFSPDRSLANYVVAQNSSKLVDFRFKKRKIQ